MFVFPHTELLPRLRRNRPAHGRAPRAVFALGVDPAQGPEGGLAGVGAGEFHQVGRGLVHGLQVHRVGANRGGGADEEVQFACGHAGGLGA